MSFQPDQITRQNVLDAIEKINREKLQLIASTRYDVIIGGAAYPPKEVMRYAHAIMNGEHTWEKSGGGLTNRYLEAMGFEIREKKEMSDPVGAMIEKYKSHIAAGGLKNEVYKWELLRKYRGRPDTEAPDFNEEVRTTKYSNLIYQIAVPVIKELAQNYPEEYRDCFRSLFDEQVNLAARIKLFSEETLKLYRKIHPGTKLGTHHDERTMAALLTVHDPLRYTFYKDSFYQKFCGLLGVRPRKTGEKLVHYLGLLNEFIDEYIASDPDLIEIVNKNLPPDVFDDANHKLLAQDMLYQMLDLERSGYWIFQSTPSNYDLIADLKSGMEIDSWLISAHKDKMQEGDKVILWAAGKNAGCYAFAEITSSPVPDEDTNLAEVGIRITHNLVGSPILLNQVRDTRGLEKLKVGRQGTTFQATENEYNIMQSLIRQKRYWLYAPGQGAGKWEEFYSEGIMALGWEELGDLNEYESQQEIMEQLKVLQNTTSSKANDSLATFSFSQVMRPGDIVIPKRGRNIYLGYGVVTSDYIYDGSRAEYKSKRYVDWKNKGEYPETEGPFALKTLTDITKYPDYVERLKELLGIGRELTAKTNMPLNTILYGPPGTGKTYNSIDKAVEIIRGSSSPDHHENKRDFDEFRRQGQIEFVTFHQSYSYEDFVVGITPDISAGGLRFDKRDGIFKVMCERARQNWAAATRGESETVDFNEVFDAFFSRLIEEEVDEVEIPMRNKRYKITSITDDGRIKFTKQSGGTGHDLLIRNVKAIYEGSLKYGTDGLGVYYYPLVDKLREFEATLRPEKHEKEIIKDYVLVIDEINRANISKVFGELITLLEEDKRLGAENELTVTLPNGEQGFGVPPNLFIIGTMNTADKSIALVDIALRRRFEFIGKYPDYNTLEPETSALLKKINAAIFEKKKSADYLIGHAYFMNSQPVKTVLQNRVIPLLMEYFSGKTEIVSSIFTNSGWNAIYDTDSFEWIVTKE